MTTLVETRAQLLKMAVEHPERAFLANSRKQVYALRVREIDPERNRLALAKPSGRRDTVDPGQPWQVRIRDGEGVYEAEVRHLVPDDTLLWVSLPEHLTFLARRRSLRLSTEGRSPTEISFASDSVRYAGWLVDVSMDGLGIEIAAERSEEWPLAMDGEVHDIVFSFRSKAVRIAKGKIAHASMVADGHRLGIELIDPDSAVLEVLHEMIEGSNQSPRSFASPA